MRFCLVLLALLLSMLPAVQGETAPQRVSYSARKVDGVRAHVVTVNLNEPSVRLDVGVATGFPGTDEPFPDLVKRHGAVAAINGAYFSRTNLFPIGDLVSEGKLLHSGRMGTALAITPDNRVEIRRVVWGKRMDWSAYRTVLACGPLLVKDGEVDVRPMEERFRDPHVLGAGARSAVGVTEANKLLLVCVPQSVTFVVLAQVMKSLGCQQAMNLDGGASMALWYRGRAVVPAGRRLTNVLLVHEER